MTKQLLKIKVLGRISLFILAAFSCLTSVYAQQNPSTTPCHCDAKGNQIHCNEDLPNPSQWWPDNPQPHSCYLGSNCGCTKGRKCQGQGWCG